MGRHIFCPGCGRWCTHYARGLCKTCYEAWRRRGYLRTNPWTRGVGRGAWFDMGEETLKRLLAGLPGRTDGEREWKMIAHLRGMRALGRLTWFQWWALRIGSRFRSGRAGVLLLRWWMRKHPRGDWWPKG